VNKILLVGRITKDLELKQTQSGISYVRFTIAVDRSHSNANNERITDFISCIVWRAQAENLVKYQGKGSLISIEGSLMVNNYESNGTRTTFTEVSCDNIRFLERRDARPAPTNNTPFEPNEPINFNKPITNDAPNNEISDFSSIDDDDDLPF